MKTFSTNYEKKWQKRWADANIFKTEQDDNSDKSFILIEFPYPSGNGLHVGHTRPYTAMDAIARKRRMQGQNILFPVGWDAFGLPTENFAIANHIHPSIVTERNIANFRSQLDALGYSFDWDREVNTTDPSYYKWTQWIFLKLFEKGLAYKAHMPVNWCTSCLCVLANEEVVDGVCERCSSTVVRREKSQWMLKITAYAQKLIDGLDTVDFSERVKAQQRNWIGRSEGAEVDFTTTAGNALRIYTTRPDTLFGATYMVISPEHPYVEQWKGKLANYNEVVGYREAAAKKSDFERTELVKDKTGVRLDGVAAVNPVNGKEIPIFVSDYVLMTYGTGAIMAVPGHDTRDWEFAKTFNLPVVEVISGGNIDEAAFTDTETGKLVNSDFLNGLEVAEAKKKITDWLVEKNLGEAKVNYKLRDWVFSRQRYWGEPIPIVHCKSCGAVPVPYDELPLTLPMVDSYEPTESGESPLSKIREWVEVKCPKCGQPAERETDTMPQWAGSSWYFLRYTDNHNDKELASRKAMDEWTPVSWYNGGMEHTTLHLLYSRFWHRFLFDIGVVPTAEPYKKRTSHGMILGEGSEKMSKSRGNVVNPSDIIDEFGADTMRLYILFIGDFEKAAAWSSQAVKGCRRFIEKVWSLSEKAKPTQSVTLATESLLHKTIKKVTEDIEQLKFNTAIAQLMTLTNELSSSGASRGDLNVLLRLLSPFAPHTADELWEQLGFDGFCCRQKWPVYDAEKTIDSEVTLAVQVNGKLRASIVMPLDSQDDDVIKAAVEDPKIKQHIEGKEVARSIVVKNKIVNLVVKN